jgi:hypothetical protein
MKKILFANSAMDISVFAKKMYETKKIILKIDLKSLVKNLITLVYTSVKKITGDNIAEIFSYLVIVFFFLQILRIESWGYKVFFSIILFLLAWLIKTWVFKKKQ